MTISNLRHITSVSNAIAIAQTNMFANGKSIAHYDGGMNFLGVLGENSNTQPNARGAILVCSWDGAVSQPLRWDTYSVRTPGVLQDFNGSGEHFQNNDPRYLLPKGSTGLRLDQIIIEDYQQLIDLSITDAGFFLTTLYKKGWINKNLVDRTFDLVKDINKQAKHGRLSIRVA